MAPRRQDPKHSIGFPEALWVDLESERAHTGETIKTLVNQAARFRINYARAARAAGTVEPARVFQEDKRLLDDLRRWCNDR